MSGRYDSNEFDEIKYFGTTASDFPADGNTTRKSYYGVSGIPHLVWQGTLNQVGAGLDVMDGHTYDPIVQSGLPEATPIMLRVTSVNYTGSPHVSLEVELDDDMADISNHFVRVFVVEDNLSYSSYPDVDGINRNMLAQEPLTINSAGQVQNIELDFTVDAGWNIANLHILAFVQRDSDKLILQGCNSKPKPPFSFRYYSLGDRVLLADGQHQYDEFAVFNTGTISDTYDLTVDQSLLPAGWSAWFTDGVDTFTSLSVTLAPGESASYNFVLDPAGNAGGGQALLTMHSQGLRTDDRQISYSLITTDTEILMVDDDGGETYETDYFGPALNTLGRSWAIWDRNSAALTAEILNNFDAVVWGTAFAFPTFDADDRAALGAYLDGGGALFATGQDIGWELNDEGGAAYQWYHDYLHANFVADNSSRYALSGVPGDPVSDGLTVGISGGDGAGNQDYPEAINPYGSYSHVIFTYDGSSYNGGIAADTGTYRVVYLGFGYEAVNNAADRELLMQRVMAWLIPDLTGTPDTAPLLPVALRQNVPNPFNPTTEISYTLSAGAQVKLSVYDAQGRLVTVLDEGQRVAGEHKVVWNGRDAQNKTVSSGLYFYRIDSGEESRTRKMMMLK